MSRLLVAMRTDLVVQWRNRLYAIGIGAAVFVAVALSQLASQDGLGLLVPTLMLLVVGGSTLLYVAALIIFEKDEGTLRATLVSPLRHWEYLGSKIATLTLLATLEALVMIGGAMGLMSFDAPPVTPDIPLLICGILAIGLVYTLIGIILCARFETITDALIPMGAVAMVLQLPPCLYFLGWVEHPAFLGIPTSAPTMLVHGAYNPLSVGDWLYALGYTSLLLVVLGGWAYRVFDAHLAGGR